MLNYGRRFWLRFGIVLIAPYLVGILVGPPVWVFAIEAAGAVGWLVVLLVVNNALRQTRRS